MEGFTAYLYLKENYPERGCFLSSVHECPFVCQEGPCADVAVVVLFPIWALGLPGWGVGDTMGKVPLCLAPLLEPVRAHTLCSVSRKPGSPGRDREGLGRRPV